MADLARIKGNIGKMLGQNAPEADIDRYIASEGVSLDDVRNFKASKVTVDPATNQPPGVPEFDPGVSGYDPQTGEVQKYGKAGSAAMGAADMVTFGAGDEASALLGTGIDMLPGWKGHSYSQNLAEIRGNQHQAQTDNPGSYLAGQVAGAVAQPSKTAATVPAAILHGAVTGGLYGFGSGEGGFKDRAENAAIDAAAGGAAGGLVRAGANALGAKAATAVIPSNGEIRKAAQAAYNKAEAAGVVVKPSGMQRLGQTIVQDLYDFGYDPALQPGVAAVVSRLGKLAKENVTLKGLDVVRRVAGNAAKIPGNPSQQAAASKIIDRIDDFIETLPEEDVLAGNVQQGSAALKEARTLWGRLRRSEMVDSAATKAELRAASTGSGGNVDNATRQNVRRLVENPRGMSAKEKELAEVVVRGTKGQNALRLAGKLSPQGNGLMTTLGVGGAMVNPVLGIPALVGSGSKMLADRATMRNVEKLSQVIRSGGKTGNDLAKLARGGEMDIPAVQRIEKFAGRIGIPVSQIAAMLREHLATATAE